jgi:hypothetical protein
MIVAFALSACASLTKTKIDKKAASETKSVAIVGFNLAVEEPKSIIGDFKKAKDLFAGDAKDANQQHATADQMYDELNGRLSKLMNWQMKPRAAVASNPAYAALVTKYTTGLQVGGMMTPANFQKLRPNNMLDAEPVIYKMTMEQRDALMKELGVEAIAANFVLASLKNESMFGGMVGAAKYKPKTQNVFRLYVRGQKDPIWLDTWAWGEGDKALQASANFVGDNLILDQVVLATRRSYDALAENYRKH